MIEITWQDGFEGGEVLSSVYSQVGLGSSIVTGRNGGHGLSGSVGGVGIGLTDPHDPLIVGIARLAPVGGAANITLSDSIGAVASLSIDVLGRVAVNLPTLIGNPTVASPSDPRMGAVWRYIEWYHASDHVIGRIIVHVDGEPVIDFTGSTGPAGSRGPAQCAIGGSGTIDDFYVGLPGSESDFFGDYVVTGLAPGATGSVPALSDVKVDQQYITYANEAPKQNATVDQQYIIVVIKNKAPTHVRPQVFGVGR